VSDTFLTLALTYLFIKAGASLGVQSMKQGPEEVLNHLKINAELLNLPKMGHDENVAYFAAQLNIAPAQPHSSGKSCSLLMFWAYIDGLYS